MIPISTDPDCLTFQFTFPVVSFGSFGRLSPPYATGPRIHDVSWNDKEFRIIGSFDSAEQLEAFKHGWPAPVIPENPYWMPEIDDERDDPYEDFE